MHIYVHTAQQATTQQAAHKETLEQGLPQPPILHTWKHACRSAHLIRVLPHGAHHVAHAKGTKCRGAVFSHGLGVWCHRARLLRREQQLIGHLRARTGLDKSTQKNSLCEVASAALKT